MSDSNETELERSRQQEEVQRTQAESYRRGYVHLVQQAEETSLADAQIRLKADATRAALENVRQMTEVARKAEDGAREATFAVRKVQADLNALAAKLETEAREAAVTAARARHQAEEAPGNEALQRAAGEAEQIAQGKRAAADAAKQIAEKPDRDQSFNALAAEEQTLLTAAIRARQAEATALAAWEQARREEELMRSRLQSGSSGRWQAFWSRVSLLMTPESLIGATLLILGLAGLGMIAYAIFFGDFLVRVKDVNVARGLITFLVALSAVIIAMIVTLYAIVSTDKELLEKKFGFGKEIFTAFVGILGTIIGFYFATDRSGEHRAEAPIPFLSLDRSEVSAGDVIRFTSLIYTGKPPFNWTVSSTPDGIAATGADPDGYIEAPLAIPVALPKGDYTVRLKVVDDAGNEVGEASSTLNVNVKPEPQSATPN